MNDTIINEFNNLNVNKLLQLVQSMETNCNHPSYFSNKNKNMFIDITNNTYLQITILSLGFAAYFLYKKKF